MISRLRGELLESNYTSCVIDCGGVGYEAGIPLSTFEKLPHVGEQVELFIHTQVREDAITLFGFATEEERKLFRLVQNVSGIGGKLALNILSAMPVDTFRNAVVGGDLKMLSRISGVGKRTAERIVVELKDKLDSGFSAPVSGTAAAQTDAMRDAAAALEQLGFKRDAIDKALRKLVSELDPAECTTENLLRRGIQLLNF
ncbi:MAG: Holliday junction branch migration protein RuvA [Lentisphaeria bacterium]|nr:Holliday junction branch migration protein RuvA [Lentisphaeria bacterium]